jgi:hypothetical protein
MYLRELLHCFSGQCVSPLTLCHSDVGKRWVYIRSPPERKEVVNGVSCSPPTLTSSISRINRDCISAQGKSLLHVQEASRDSRPLLECDRTPVSRLHNLQEPHSHSPNNLNLRIHVD